MHNNICIITCGVAQIKNGKFNNHALLQQAIVHYTVNQLCKYDFPQFI